MRSKKSNRTLGKSSPKGLSRGCLCKDGKTYSRKCCDGTLLAQGIGRIYSDGEVNIIIKRPPRAFSEGFSNGFE